MPVPYDSDTGIGGPHHQFPTTRHPLVQAAARRGDPSREAMDAVVSAYWKPIYKHVRLHWKRSNEDAKDLVQGFFAALVEQDILSKYDSTQGRLRTYLRACLDHYVLKQDESANRLKRGAGVTFDFTVAEREIAASDPSPEDIFQREWERETFGLAMDDLRRDCLGSERWERYQVFERYDLAEGNRPSYADIAEELRIPVTTVTNHLAWARRELRRFVLARSL